MCTVSGTFVISSDAFNREYFTEDAMVIPFEHLPMYPAGSIVWVPIQQDDKEVTLELEIMAYHHEPFTGTEIICKLRADEEADIELMVQHSQPLSETRRCYSHNIDFAALLRAE